MHGEFRVVFKVALVAITCSVGCGSSTQATGSDAAAANGPRDSSVSANDMHVGKLGSEGGVTSTLSIQPTNAVLQATSAGGSFELHAFLNDSKTPVSAAWSIVAGPAAGTVNSSSGLFTASGLVGGRVTVQASYQSLQAQTQLTVFLSLQDNLAGLTAAQQQPLKQGGSLDAGEDTGFEWLYPYDKTVFPRGLMPPTLQFGGAAPDAVYVHVSEPALDYEGFFGPSNPGQATVTPAIWTAITESAGATDPVKVEVTKISSGQVSGPITETWTIAQGSLKGAVYYESRDAFSGGATMRIRPGAPQAENLFNSCTVCHYVSANGSTIVAYAQLATATYSASFDLTQDAGLIYQEPSERFAFGALTPDGTLLMTMGTLPATNPGQNDWVPDVAGFNGNSPARMLNPRDGGSVAAAGWDDKITTALMSTFSPDGKFIAFNHYDTGSGHSLALMSFDQPTVSFSGLTDFATDPLHFLGWPTFTPDDEWVLFHADNNGDYVTWGSEVTANTLPDAKADLMVAHLPSKTVASLDQLNGVMNGQYYLPFGETAEGHMNYMPTILPVAVGGYYWVVFTSRREYGNTINNPDPYYIYAAETQPEAPWRKKLWVAAIDVDDPSHPSTSAHDISHPAFYLSGQDLLPGNYRGFWALSPCQANGTSCASGDECCTGFCRPGGGPGAAVDASSETGGSSAPTGFVCVAQPGGGCSNEYEKCSVTSDCCQASQGIVCINGYCGQTTPH
jgi:hypothetical protein